VVLHLEALSAAAAALTMRLLISNTTETTPVLVLGKSGNENRMH